MPIAKLFVANRSLLALDSSDLVYLIGLYAEVVGIKVIQHCAYVHVASRTQAYSVIDELCGRFVRGAQWPPLQVKFQRGGSYDCGKRPTVSRHRVKLADPMWRYVVSNIDPDVDFERVEDLFQPFGVVCWSWRNAYKTYGHVLVRITCRKERVVAQLNGLRLGSHRLTVVVDRSGAPCTHARDPTKVTVTNILSFLCTLCLVCANKSRSLF